LAADYRFHIGAYAALCECPTTGSGQIIVRVELRELKEQTERVIREPTLF
jgi:hypothetical protein